MQTWTFSEYNYIKSNAEYNDCMGQMDIPGIIFADRELAGSYFMQILNL